VVVDVSFGKLRSKEPAYMRACRMTGRVGGNETSVNR
jgi:hypothetical protein